MLPEIPGNPVNRHPHPRHQPRLEEKKRQNVTFAGRTFHGAAHASVVFMWQRQSSLRMMHHELQDSFFLSVVDLVSH